jgi:hypothetical protein
LGQFLPFCQNDSFARLGLLTDRDWLTMLTIADSCNGRFMQWPIQAMVEQTLVWPFRDITV